MSEGIHAFGINFGTIFQGGMLLTMLTLLGVWWVRGMPDRQRALNEARAIDNTDAALRFKEFRLEVHALRNELQVVRGELHKAQTKSARRGDMLNMLRFILQMVLDELAAKDPGNKVLTQAKKLLTNVEMEPHQVDESDALRAAEDTVEAANATVRQVKADEARA